MAGRIRATNDPFDDVLSLEDTFYKEGLQLGHEDGEQAGRLEGRAFGLEKGFEKSLALGRFHGAATVWAGRMDAGDRSVKVYDLPDNSESRIPNSVDLHFPLNSRLALHIKSLFALTEIETVPTNNTEDEIADLDDRLRRAEGKAKVIEKLTGESVPFQSALQRRCDSQGKRKHDSGIEDIGVLNARH